LKRAKGLTVGSGRPIPTPSTKISRTRGIIELQIFGLQMGDFRASVLAASVVYFLRQWRFYSNKLTLVKEFNDSCIGVGSREKSCTAEWLRTARRPI
jgi:hypothetical protein